jgi:hypothetical protein
VRLGGCGVVVVVKYAFLVRFRVGFCFLRLCEYEGAKAGVFVGSVLPRQVVAPRTAMIMPVLCRRFLLLRCRWRRLLFLGGLVLG